MAKVLMNLVDRLEEEMADPTVYESYSGLEKVLKRHTKLLDEYVRLAGGRSASACRVGSSASIMV